MELVATSSKSFEDAVKHAIEDANRTTRGITGCEVQRWSVRCRDGKVSEYRVDLKLVFGIEHSPQP